MTLYHACARKHCKERAFLTKSQNKETCQGAPACLQVPDIMSLQSPQDLKLEEGVAAVVKFGLSNLFNLAAKV